MSIYSIKDLENLSGIKAHTIRIWEQRYGILNPNRTDSNIRTYDDDELKKVLNIALLQEKGNFKISKIAKMSEEEISKEILKLSETILSNSDQVKAISIAMLDMDENKFQKISNNIINKEGFENYILEIIYPFLSRLGTLWLSGTVGPAQEHFITHLIRQKIIGEIDSIQKDTIKGLPKFILYLPEGELHEISLLFAYYILKKRGFTVYYLGQSLPFDELVLANNICKPDYILSVFTSIPNPNEINDYLQRLSKELTNTNVMVSGYQILHSNLIIPSNIKILPSFDELVSIAEELAISSNVR